MYRNYKKCNSKKIFPQKKKSLRNSRDKSKWNTLSNIDYIENFNQWILASNLLLLETLYSVKLLSVVKMSFYVAEPSDSSLNYFLDNKISHFVTCLPEHVKLHRKWKVELSEFHSLLPPTSYNENSNDDFVGNYRTTFE